MPEESKGLKFASRRTVVKGMASAVPVVMTLGNGAALAQHSADCTVDALSETGALERGSGILSKGLPSFDPYGSDPMDLDASNSIEPTGIAAKGKPSGWYIDSTESLSNTSDAGALNASAGCSMAG